MACRRKRFLLLTMIALLIACGRPQRVPGRDLATPERQPIATPVATPTASGQVRSPVNVEQLIPGILSNPRGVAIGPQGEIYVADAGTSSDPYSGRVVGIRADSTVDPILGGAGNSVSSASSDSYIYGLSNLTYSNDSLYVVTGVGAWLQSPFLAPGKLLKETAGSEWVDLFDFALYEQENDPDGNGSDSDAYGVAVSPAGEIWITDAAGNWAARLNADGSVAGVTVLPKVNGEEAVPTGVAVGPDGSAYVTLFRCQEPTKGKRGVVRIDGDGRVTTVVSGLNNPLSVAFDSTGDMYVLEFAVDYQPNSGALVRVSSDGAIMDIVDHLSFPTSLAINQSDVAYITEISSVSGGEFGTGKLLKLGLAQTGS